VSAGPTVPDATEAIARHELRLTVAELSRAARRLLVPGGRAAVVFPSERLTDLLGALDAEGLRPTRLRPIYARPGLSAGRVLVEAVKGARGGLVLEEPLLVRNADGGYTDEAREALGET
jgi:tRNA1Val (adenine37-N6)-methyltransferase